MFTTLRDTVDSLFDQIIVINKLLLAKKNSLIIKLTNCDELEYLSLLKLSDLLNFISLEIKNVSTMLSKVNIILDNTETYLEELVNYVPHYDEVTMLSMDADEADDENDDADDENEDEDNFQPYQQVYLDNLLEKVTNEELKYYTSDNGKIIQDCRNFIPSANIQLNVLSQIFRQVEIILNNDDLIPNNVHICCDTIHTFTIQFTTFLNGINM